MLVFMDRGAVIEQGAPGQVIETPRSERTCEFLRGCGIRDQSLS